VLFESMPSPAAVYGALNFAYTETSSPPATESGFVQMLFTDQQAGRAAVFATNESPTDSQLAPGHAYMVNAVLSDSTGAPAAVSLRNPWGADDPGEERGREEMGKLQCPPSAPSGRE